MPQQSFNQSDCIAQIKQYGPDQEAQPGEFEPGDFILTHGKGLYSWLIRFGQSIRYQGENRKYIWWNHAALIVSKEGDLIEALDRGVVRTRLSNYKAPEYHLVRLPACLGNAQDRLQIVGFAERSVNQKYGWLTIGCIALALLTGGKFTFGIDGQFICSGLVARALERSHVIFDRTPSHIMPADLAEHFKVQPPKPATKMESRPAAYA